MMLRYPARALAIVLICLAVTVTGLVWYFYGISRPETIVAQVLPCPDISKGCSNASVRVQVDRQPRVLQPFNIMVTLYPPALPETGMQEKQATEKQITEVHADFAMAGMQMGLNRYRLVQQNKQTWQAMVTLPICVQGRSLWDMRLELRLPGTPSGSVTQRYTIQFQAN